MEKIKRSWHFIQEYSVLLILGAICALIMVNTSPDIYHGINHFVFSDNNFIGHYHDGHYELSVSFLVNDILMTLFFAVAGKEVWEAIALKSGSLRGKQAFSTVFSTVGGVVGPVLIYFVISLILGSFSELKNGWAIPTATDIAFAYLVGRLIFGKNHPALSFLLAIAILDDAIGLIILAIFYPSGNLAPKWLLLSLFVTVFVYFVFNFLPRKFDDENKKTSNFVKNKLGFWPYVIACLISWYAFFKAGVHPVLSFIPIIMTIPHAETDFGLFAEEDAESHDLLNKFEHRIEPFIPIVLGLFGFVNAGVPFSSINDATFSVTGGLLIGKVLGITAFGILAMKVFGLPNGMKKRDLPVLGAIAGIGFTVALFVSVQAFASGEIQDGAKMGALFSFFASVLAFILAKVFKVRKIE